MNAGDSVFVLWHVHPSAGEEGAKLIGIYGTAGDAEAAIARLITKPGFSGAPDGFKVDEYEMGKDHWAEGYVTV